MKILVTLCFILFIFNSFAQDLPGLITGNVLDEKKNSLAGATINIFSERDTIAFKTSITDRDGSFSLQNIPFGYHRLRISYIGFQTLAIDSIYLRKDRLDFNLNDIVLKTNNGQSLAEVIIYAEKPLIQSKDGNITFNAAESALSAGSTANELLSNVPLITKDPTGKLLVRGKEPKVLIDDKPVELNQQQLQDLLESLPGSAIEKIEVMTNPPPQYANEQGGVINITTRKGKVGKSGRITISAGTRGEASVNGNFNYRKKGFAMNINAGAGYNEFDGRGYSIRQNFYRDSSNRFQTENGSNNKNLRPNLRVNMDYDFDKFNALNFVFQYNQNFFNNDNATEFKRINRLDNIYQLSERLISSNGENFNPNLSLTYTRKSKRPGQVFKLISNANLSNSENFRDFYQQYLNPDLTFTGLDSSQKYNTHNKTKGYNLRANYDLPLKNKKTFFSIGSFYNTTHSELETDATYKRKGDGKWVPLLTLTNDLRFHQYVSNMRVSARQILKENVTATAGVALEKTRINFELRKNTSNTNNTYTSILPFFNLNRNWKDVLNLTASYRRTIRRPGLNELNPIIDSSDLYNLRVGNPQLEPSLVHNFDFVVGKTKKSFFANVGLGYSILDDVFNQFRERINDTTTRLTWQNSSGKKEYEISTWNGYTLSKRTKVNLSASYTYNEYSSFDKIVRKFRDGGSFTANINTNYNWNELYNATGSFTYNRFANPQGSFRSNLSMNIGLQTKVIPKLTITLNFIDPFREQQSKTFVYGSNFILENYNLTGTRNIRLSLSYNFNKSAKRNALGVKTKKEKLSEKTKKPVVKNE